jgi:hypothetical protein
MAIVLPGSGRCAFAFETNFLPPYIAPDHDVFLRKSKSWRVLVAGNPDNKG